MKDINGRDIQIGDILRTSHGGKVVQFNIVRDILIGRDKEERILISRMNGGDFNFQAFALKERQGRIISADEVRAAGHKPEVLYGYLNKYLDKNPEAKKIYEARAMKEEPSRLRGTLIKPKLPVEPAPAEEPSRLTGSLMRKKAEEPSRLRGTLLDKKKEGAGPLISPRVAGTSSKPPAILGTTPEADSSAKLRGTLLSPRLRGTLIRKPGQTL